jgi:hypothetical protein
MLTIKQKAISLLLSIIILTISSGFVLYYCQRFFIEALYHQSFFDCISIAALFIAVVSILNAAIFNKGAKLNINIHGLICLLLDLLIFSMITLPTVGFHTDRFLWHLIGVGFFCFFIPYTRYLLVKLLYKDDPQ